MREEFETTKKAFKRTPVSTIITYAGLLIYTLFLFIPLLMVFTTAFMSIAELKSLTDFRMFPHTFSLEAFNKIFEEDIFVLLYGRSSLVIGFFNTIWMTLLTQFGALLFSGLAAYAYSLLDVPGKKFFWAIEMATMMLPLGSMVIVSYLFYNSLGWVGTVLPIILPGMFGNAGVILYLKTYIDGLGREMFESAKIDGAGVLSIFAKFILPLGFPAFVARFIFGFVGGYNNYIGPMLYLTGIDERITLQLAISQINTSFKGNETVQCASAVLGMLPLVVIYCALQKFFIKGIAVGGGKE